ncbi:DUF1501 domain-containing protein [Planctomyces sp. SH-PL14]|uniref:DUF1501 domain-containing protein n=1 Tax=Planctomyces sp. SH-PL14 TaxID=1632864 RepID=UPI00078E4664|nr:DUF1501 domain-containing protein [Planctomyces sp. SH-PL14]AMV17064.1 hypothetical protein VT03_04180 [Planctomyces sp. SH-PL14]
MTEWTQQTTVARRWFLQQCGVGLGRIGLATLLAQDGLRSSSASAAPTAPGAGPFAPRPSHFPGPARAVIHLFMAGAPSHIDLFDRKPELIKHDGKPLPPSVYGDQRYAFIRPDAAVMAPRFPFSKYGECGMELGSPLPYLGSVADDVCLLRAVSTDQFNHAPAQLLFNTGFAQPGRASIGSWVTYGLGCETQNLPAFVVMSTGSGISGGSANWSSGFLPTVYTGVRLRNQGDPILNVANPPGIDAGRQRNTLDLVRDLNRIQLDEMADPEIATRINSYEMAFRLQTSAPELMNLASESEATLKAYGCDGKEPAFAKACLTARRMVERGVRFVNIYHEGWDAHSDLLGNHTNNCRKTDQACAALVADLKERGLLDSTLVIWGGEFGRTPMVQTDPSLGTSLGRDHHPQAFSMWMAGGGVKGGLTYGETDDFGFHAVDRKVHVHDLQATILHCLGLDHTRLTFPLRGLDFRLTGVEPHAPVREILA